MSSSSIGSGGFLLPQIYRHEQKKVEDAFARGELDYVDLSQWSFADELLCFSLQSDFFRFADRSYPNPRVKNEVPIWFLVASQLVLRVHNSGVYSQLDYFLNSGSVLTKIGFNVGGRGSVGFNNKNIKSRKTAVNHDTVRKYFRDTDPKKIREWYNNDVQTWFRTRKAYDPKGLFILDQSHLVVPKNDNYKDAVYMPVDEHGQLYKNLSRMTEEQKKALPYHPCYSLSCLLHVGPSSNMFHVAGYDFAAGNEDELPQAQNLVPNFCKKYPEVMKELIVDRGYLSGEFISELKKKHGVDILIPLKSHMDDYKDAFEIAKKKEWKKTGEIKDREGRIVKETRTAFIENMELWNNCSVKLQVYVNRTKKWNAKSEQYEEHCWALASTKKYPSEKAAIQRYSLRTQVEERFRQLKRSWNIGKFPSPAPGLRESHVCFILLTYSLLQLYLRRKDLREMTRKTIETLRRDESLGKNVVLVYHKGGFAVLNLDDCLLKTISMSSESQQKLRDILEKQKEVRGQRYC